MLREVQETSGGLLGELVSDAIEFWYENLLEETEDGASDAARAVADIPLPQVGHNIAK